MITNGLSVNTVVTLDRDMRSFSAVAEISACLIGISDVKKVIGSVKISASITHLRVHLSYIEYFRVLSSKACCCQHITGR